MLAQLHDTSTDAHELVLRWNHGGKEHSTRSRSRVCTSTDSPIAEFAFRPNTQLFLTRSLAAGVSATWELKLLNPGATKEEFNAMKLVGQTSDAHEWLLSAEQLVRATAAAQRTAVRLVFNYQYA